MRIASIVIAVFTINAGYAQQLIPADSSIEKGFVKKVPAAHHSKIVAIEAPAAGILYGLVSLGHNGLNRLDISTKNEISEDHPAFMARADNFLQYAPGLAAYTLPLLGIKGKNNFRDKTIIYLLASVISSVTVTAGKSITKRERPDLSSSNSFPSGHTTNAFEGAEFLRQEYKDVSPWYAAGGYLVATATGALRVYNNRHWISDVVAGAGIGVLSTRIAYWIYPTIKKRFFNGRKKNSKEPYKY